MAIKALVARQRTGDLYLRVHLDETKVDGQGQPLAAYVREYSFGLPPPQGVTLAAYKASVAAEVKLLAQADLAALSPPAAGSALPIEGTVL